MLCAMSLERNTVTGRIAPVHSTGGLTYVRTSAGGSVTITDNSGGIFNYGDARFYGSAGSLHLNAPIVAMKPTPDGGGY